MIAARTAACLRSPSLRAGEKKVEFAFEDTKREEKGRDGGGKKRGGGSPRKEDDRGTLG